MPDNTQDLSAQKNSIVTDWSKELVAEVRAEVGKLKATESGALQKSISKRIRRRYGDPEVVSIYYRYWGKFIIPGVGKSYPLKRVKGMNASLNPRKPRDWYNEKAAKATEELADKLAAVNADAYVNNLNI